MLNCKVIGAMNLNPVITYLWTKNNDTLTNVVTNSSVFHFCPLRLSDAGNYSCEINLTSRYLNQTLNIKSERQAVVNLKGEVFARYVSIQCSTL